MFIPEILRYFFSFRTRLKYAAISMNKIKVLIENLVLKMKLLKKPYLLPPLRFQIITSKCLVLESPILKSILKSGLSVFCGVLCNPSYREDGI